MYMLSIYVAAVKYQFKIIEHRQNNEYTLLVQSQCAKLSSGILVIQITQMKKHSLQKVDKIKISSAMITQRTTFTSRVQFFEIELSLI
jgi:hypothetical protein